MQQIFLFASLLMFATGCSRSVQPQSAFAECLNRFPPRPDWPDTMHCFLAETPAGLPISDTLLKTVLDSTQFESLHFGTGEARFWALGQFPFAEGLVAGLLRTEEFWFGKQSLLIFDLRHQKCLTVVELSHFYGGDGGQTASESWLFRGAMPPRLFVKNAEHWFALPDTPADEPQEHLQESGQLYQWDTNRFRALPNPDSLPFLRQYTMHRTW